MMEIKEGLRDMRDTSNFEYLTGLNVDDVMSIINPGDTEDLDNNEKAQ